MATERMEAPSPILGPFLRWARRYVGPLAHVAVVAAIVGAVFPTGERLYRTSVVVIPTATEIPLDNLSSVAQAAFQTDTVMQPVIKQLGLRVTPQQLVNSDQLTAQPVATTGALRITGESRDPRLATDLVNAAASSFIAAAGQKGLGTFSQFGAGVAPQLSPVLPFPIKALAGAVAALVVGVIVLVVLYVGRRPVMSKDAAREVIPARQVFGVRYTGGRRLSRTRSNGFRVQPSSFYDGLREALVEGDPRSPSVCWIYAGPQTGPEHEQTMRLITSFHGNDEQHAGTEAPVVVSARGPVAPAVLQSELVVMFVVAGVRRNDLVHVGEELDTSPGDRDLILVFVD